MLLLFHTQMHSSTSTYQYGQPSSTQANTKDKIHCCCECKACSMASFELIRAHKLGRAGGLQLCQQAGLQAANPLHGLGTTRAASLLWRGTDA